MADTRHCVQWQDLMNRLGCSNLYSDAGFADLDADVRSNYLMNTSLSGISQADVVLLVGSNPRVEAPVLNARCAQCSKHVCTVDCRLRDWRLSY